MAGNILSISRQANFNCRVKRCLDNANIPRDSFKNLHRFPLGVRAFHMITPHALQVLDKDLPLLSQINARIMKAQWLNGVPQVRLREKGLTLGYCHDSAERVVLFYTLRGPSQQEAEIIALMRNEFVERPTLEDAGIVYEAFGLKLKTQGVWNYDEVKKLIDADKDRLLFLINCRTMTVVASLGDDFGLGRANDIVHLVIPRSDLLKTRSLDRFLPA